jgi:diaminohydroxyphosphoribosylaminopyrimidine deaminase/5-amino-6-(5-phosphoribosylamino)uracil reductase
MGSGESQWITSPASRRDVQRLRAAAGAILTGIDTVIADDPSLTVREADIDTDDRQPLRAVVDSQLRMPPSARLLQLPGETRIFTVTKENQLTDDLIAAGSQVNVTTVDEENGRVNLQRVLQLLAEYEINDVLVEGGPTLSGSLMQAGLVDEFIIYQAPHFMGSETRGMLQTPQWIKLKQRLELEILDLRNIDNDMRITARPRQSAATG